MRGGALMKRYFIKLLVAMCLLLTAAFVQAQEKRYSLPFEDSPSFGPSDAAVTMIEFIDYL